MDNIKKAERKRRRFAARLKHSKDVVCTDVPGINIVLCNMGQATGLEKNIIHKSIKDNSIDIILPKFIAEKGETYSFLVFNSTEDATTFYNKFNGKPFIQNKVPVFMNFVEKVPSTDFECQDEYPRGLTLLNNFITAEEEELFMKIFNWATDIESNNLKNREVKHYGYQFRYGTNDVDLNDPSLEKIPKECDLLWRRLKAQGFDLGVPDQLTVNKYSPGQGIPSHVDKHSPFGRTILSLSLGSDVVMDWRHHTGKYVPVVVHARSLLIMQDEARYDWQHGIQSRTWDPAIEYRSTDDLNTMVRVITSDKVARGMRVSLTFRWTRRGPCGCPYRMLCDTALPSCPDEELEEKLASDLEELHVHQVYEEIASHFSSTRFKPWPAVVRFLRGAPAASLVVDLGCGNGKNMLPRDDLVQIGVERSAGLARECARRAGAVRGACCVRADALRCALRDACADRVLCVAVVHHFGTRARRLQAVKTIHRLLRAGGRALITAWAKDQTQSNYLCKSKLDTRTQGETRVTVGGVALPVHQNRTQFQHKDLLVPWKLRRVHENKRSNSSETTLFRYYHVFEERELDELCTEAGLAVESSFYEEGNWCVVCEKK